MTITLNMANVMQAAARLGMVTLGTEIRHANSHLDTYKYPLYVQELKEAVLKLTPQECILLDKLLKLS